MYHQTLRQMHKQLGHLEHWFDAADAHAKAKSFDVNVLLQARLAPDQFALLRQIQSTCDTAKLGASRLSGKDAPSHPDNETTLAELRTRVQQTRAYLDTISEADLKDAATRQITQARWEGQYMLGADYFMEHMVPNFYFHLTHAYALLRHNGVAVGKRDFLGTLSKHKP